MLREQWKFGYSAEELAQAAKTKLDHHNERLVFWKDKKRAVLDTIRAEGLELDETITAALSNPKARDWHRSTQVMVRNDLQKDLAECLDKLEWHTQRRDEYDGWHQVLGAQVGGRLELDINDWLFFFGRG